MAGAYSSITVLGWPEGMSRDDAARVLVEALGLDPYTANLRVNKRPPMIVARVADAIAPSIVGVLRGKNVGVFTLTDAAVERLPPPLLAKRLESALGAPEPMYMVEAWRGEGTGLMMRDVYCVVRARVGRAKVGPPQVEVVPRPISYGKSLSWDYDVNVTHERSSQISDVIDLWLGREGANGPERIRINGDKFNWDVLGKERAMSDLQNADKLALVLASQAPHAAIETGFADFCDASAASIGSGWSATSAGGSRLDRHPAFEFYSAWCGVMHWRQ